MNEYRVKEFFNSQHGFLYEFCKEGEKPDFVFIEKKYFDELEYKLIEVRQIASGAFSTPGVTGWAALRAILGVLDD